MSVTSPHYLTLRDGRSHLKDVLDAAAEGRPASITRDHRRIAAVDADRLAHFLSQIRPAKAEVVAENDGWSIFIPGLPAPCGGRQDLGGGTGRDGAGAA